MWKSVRVVLKRKMNKIVASRTSATIQIFRIKPLPEALEGN